MSRKTYSTKEIAQMSGVHPNTVRLYEKWGFIARAERMDNHYRIFTDNHMYQMKLARVALPGPYPIDGKIVQQLVREFALNHVAGALCLANEYLDKVEAEKDRALKALTILDHWFERKTGDRYRILVKGRKQAALIMDVSVDALRTWERNGLFTLKKDSQGRLSFSEWDIEKIKVIRLLRNCGYSISSLLRVFADEENLIDKPSVLLSLPDNNADFFYVTDLFLQYLEEHIIRAQRIISLINAYEELKPKQRGCLKNSCRMTKLPKDWPRASQKSE